jgi:hypothetical protein
MWMTLPLQGFCVGLIGSLAPICPVCWCARTWTLAKTVTAAWVPNNNALGMSARTLVDLESDSNLLMLHLDRAVVPGAIERLPLAVDDGKRTAAVPQRMP